MVEKQFIFNLKTNGKELRLPPNTEDLVIKNFRSKQNLIKNIRNQVKSIQSRDNFRDKLEKHCFKQSSPAFLHYSINHMCFIYEALTTFINKINKEYQLLQIDKSTDETNKLRLVRLLMKSLLLMRTDSQAFCQFLIKVTVN